MVEREGEVWCRSAEVRLPVKFRPRDAAGKCFTGCTVKLGPGNAEVVCDTDVKVSQGMSLRMCPAPGTPGAEPAGEYAGVSVQKVVKGPPIRLLLSIEGEAPSFCFLPEFIGCHESVRSLKREVMNVARHDVNVLIQGQTGVGKNLIAGLIHNFSARSSGPFVRLNCPSVPASLLESELFGHTRGAYTGAYSASPGRFRAASGGTLLLDEICSIPMEFQTKLLRAIEEKQFVPVGGSKEVTVDVRILAATNESIPNFIRKNAFREDLYYRLNEIPIAVPSLHERRCDIPLLVDSFLRQYVEQTGGKYEPLPEYVLERFQEYGWPGNVRELQNTVRRSVLLGHIMVPGRMEDGLGEGQVPADLYDPEKTLIEMLDQVEKNIIKQSLADNGAKRTAAAAKLGLSYRTLMRKLKKHGI